MNFSELSDEELLELIKSVMSEAVHRGVEMTKSANEIYTDAQRELQIKAEVISKASAKAKKEEEERLRRQAELETQAELIKKKAEEQARTWARKAAVAHALNEDPLFKDDNGDFQINIWEGSNEVRVYIQELGKRNGWEIIYYSTGNRYHPPKEIVGLSDKEDRTRMIKFCDKLLEHFNPGLRLNIMDALTVEPDETRLEIYRQVLKPEE